MKGVKELAEKSASDQIAINLFLEFGDNLAVFLAPWLIKFRAEIVVIGGNISHAYNLFGDMFEKRLKQEGCNCRVALSELKEDSARLGAAFLMDEKFWQDIQHALPLM